MVRREEKMRAFLLHRALLPLSRGYKATTGLVGLEADVEAHQKLIQALRGLLSDAKEKLPEGTAYRRNLETVARERLDILEKIKDPEQAEEEIGGGQLEELLQETNVERELLSKMSEWKPWEVPEGHQVEVIEEGEWLRSQPKEGANE